MELNKKTVDDINVKGKRVLCRCDFNVPIISGKITDENRLVAALPTIKKLIADGGKVILCSHLGKVKEGPNEKESLAPVAKALEEKLVGTQKDLEAAKKDIEKNGADIVTINEALKSLEESNDKAHKALSDKDDELKKLIEDNQAAIKGWPVER